MRKHPILQMFVIGVIATAIGIAVALSIPWFPSQASSQSHKVDTLYDVLLIVSVPIFVLVETVVLFSVWKFRMRPGEEDKDGPPIHGNTLLEIVWTAAPAALIVSLCTYAYVVLRQDEKSKPNAQTVNVIGEQFTWVFAYPRGNGKAVVSPDLYLGKDQPVVFNIHSRDVIHAFWVPEFREQLDAVPGITGTLRVTPSRLGNYQVVCAELCGNGHALMRAPVHVVTQAQFQSWLGKQPLQPEPSDAFVSTSGAAAKTGGSVPSTAVPAGGGPPAAQQGRGAAGATSSTAQGKAIFTGTGTCGTCHTLSAAGTSGTIGPNLDMRLRADCKLPASIKVRGATLKQCITTAITKPYAFLPSGYQAGVMPATFSKQLSQSQIQALVNFLASVAK